MSNIIKKLPVPIVGLMLALAALGNLVQSYGEIYRNILGILSSIILILITLKFFIYPKDFLKDLENPMIHSVFPTFSMTIILLSTYLKPYAPSMAFTLWLVGIILHVVLGLYFTKKHLFNFSMSKVFPSWFIVYVGIVVASITAPAFDKAVIGQAIFWLGLVLYILLIPTIFKKVFKFKDMPEPALPTITILAAPTALCLAGYMNSFNEKNMTLIWILLFASQALYLFILTRLPKLLKLQFYPSYSAFTFPLVISAISLKLTNGYLTKVGYSFSSLRALILFEELIAIIMVFYVLIKFTVFIFSEKELVK